MAHDQPCLYTFEVEGRTCTSYVWVIKDNINNFTLVLRRAGLGHGFDESSGEERLEEPLQCNVNI